MRCQPSTSARSSSPVDAAHLAPFAEMVVGIAQAVDAIVLLECLHDFACPVEVLAGCREVLAPGGCVVVVDERVAPKFTAPGDLTERLMYGWSFSHCLPASMSEQPSAALGAAGFTTVETVDVDGGFFRV